MIVGHSERRADHHEDDEVCTSKVQAALRNNLVPILCVGETAEDLEQYGASKVPVDQLTAVLSSVKKGAEMVIAYEPVWAIGSGQAATPDQAEEMCKTLGRRFAHFMARRQRRAPEFFMVAPSSQATLRVS